MSNYHALFLDITFYSPVCHPLTWPLSVTILNYSEVSGEEVKVRLHTEMQILHVVTRLYSVAYRLIAT